MHQRILSSNGEHDCGYLDFRGVDVHRLYCRTLLEIQTRAVQLQSFPEFRYINKPQILKSPPFGPYSNIHSRHDQYNHVAIVRILKSIITKSSIHPSSHVRYEITWGHISSPQSMTQMKDISTVFLIFWPANPLFSKSPPGAPGH